jgi:hypothetical protein
MTEIRCEHGNAECAQCGVAPVAEPLHIHETAFDDVGLMIACDLRNWGIIDDDHFAAVEVVIMRRLKHQLGLQRTWDTEDESVGPRQLWSRPVQG